MLIIWLVCALVAAIIGSQKDRGGSGFILGFLFGPLGVIASLALSPGGHRCPYCKSPVHYGARLCPACRSQINIPNRVSMIPSLLLGFIVFVAILFLVAWWKTYPH